MLNKTDGAYVPGMSFGGKPTFSCPHKITVDEVSKKIVICDRSHSRRVWLDYNLDMSKLISQTIGEEDSSMNRSARKHHVTPRCITPRLYRGRAMQQATDVADVHSADDAVPFKGRVKRTTGPIPCSAECRLLRL